MHQPRSEDPENLWSLSSKQKYQTNNEGTTCDGKFSCGRLIYQCLSNGDKALISNGGCGENGHPDDYCVVCVPEEI